MSNKPIDGMHRFGVKIPMVGESGDLRRFVPAFHRLIQKQAVADHLLIDVADYHHVPDGPVALLVAHEGNFAIDAGDGGPGLLYTRKQPLDGISVQRVRKVVEIARGVCGTLESDAELAVRFDAGRFLLRSYDRLLLPNDSESAQALLAAAREAFPTASVERTANDPRAPLEVVVVQG